MDVLNLFDFACVYLPLSQAIGRLGNFTNQELYGTYTDLPWGMTGSRIGDIPVHPAFLYEFVFNLIIFLILLKLRKNKKVKGSVFATYLMSYSLIRFLLEFIRTDEFGTGNIRYNQVVAAAVFVLSFIWLIYLIIRSKRSEGLPAESESPEGLDTEFDNLAAEKEDNQDTVEDKGLI
jgi:phosphatidylglycerol:prolipoprotein diacylglycerol transferase